MVRIDDPRLSLPDSLDDPLSYAPEEGVDMQVTAGVSAVRATPDPDGEMVTQALHGETFTLYREEGEFGLVQLHRDRYVGWILMEAVSAPVLEVTHRVSALRSYVHSEPDLKSAPRFLVTLGAPVVAEEQEGEWVGCARAGWIHERHLQPLDMVSDDPAGIAVRYLGSPYLWGGRESLGLDCTGLTVASFGACGVTLPRDSDMQFAWAGEPIEAWDTPGVLRRGDLVFWKGHVGIMLDEVRMIHANAHHMAVAAEPLDGAIDRIAQHYGLPIGAKRLDLERERDASPDWLEG